MASLKREYSDGEKIVGKLFKQGVCRAAEEASFIRNAN